jgi:hypothetical protein
MATLEPNWARPTPPPSVPAQGSAVPTSAADRTNFSPAAEDGGPAHGGSSLGIVVH